MNGNTIGFLIFTLNFFDGFATYLMVQAFSLETEMNPFMQYLMVILSPEGWLPVKIMVGFLLWVFLALRVKELSIGRKIVFGFVVLSLLAVDSIHVLNFLCL
jgi:hypothetical protein